MALNSGKILMRRGQEVNFDPNKMIPGEWAVSLDSKYVRMCFSPGVCIRMATYEAFEADMEQIREILAECQTVEEAVQRIYEDIKDVAVDVERIEAAAASALESEENALNSANLAVQSAETAMQKAEEAEESANIASTKAEQATEGASTATQKASEAAESADNVRNMSEVSQSYAVGGTGTREGEDTDNAKYYNQQASDNADRAEAAADRASAVADVGVATTEKAGLVKPDGDTIRVDPDGTIHADRGTTSYSDLENKPIINDVELNGNKSLDELGIASKEALEETDNKVNIIIENAELRFKETASGENIHLDDSADSKLVEFGLYGKATQNGIPTPENPVEIAVAGESYNLIPYPYEITTMTVNGITWTDLGDGRIMANGTATETSSFDKFLGDQTEGLREKLQSYGEVILTGCPSGGGSSTYRLFVWGAYNDGGYSANDYGSGATFTFDNNDKAFGFSAQIIKGVKVENLIFKPMLRKASVKNDRYMLYGKGSVEVTSLGKNYYDINKTTSASSALLMDTNDNSIRVYNTSEATFVGTKFVLDSAKIKIGKTYTFSADVKYTSGSGRLVLRSKDGTITRGTNIIKASGKYSFTFVMQEVGDYLTLFCTVNTAEIGDVTYSNIQLEEGKSISEYEPYKETLATIPTENGLAGIPVDSDGNYTDSNGQQWICDEIVKYADGSGEYIKRVEKRVFDGVSNVCTWVGSSNNGTETLWQINLGGSAIMPNAVFISSKYILCDKFKAFPYTHGIDNFAYGCRQGSNKAICCLLKESDGVTNIKTANTWLQENPVTTYYIIEPIRTPLTKEQIAEIEKLKTFYPVTNISNDFDCGMKVKYIVDSKNYIDNQLAIQAKLQEEALLNMLLLMPEEVQASMIEKDTNNLLNESEV